MPFKILSLYRVFEFQISGREMFAFNPELAAGDSMEDGDEAFDSYKREDDEEGDIQVRVLSFFQSLMYCDLSICQ